MPSVSDEEGGTRPSRIPGPGVGLETDKLDVGVETSCASLLFEIRLERTVAKYRYPPRSLWKAQTLCGLQQMVYPLFLAQPADEAENELFVDTEPGTHSTTAACGCSLLDVSNGVRDDDHSFRTNACGHQLVAHARRNGDDTTEMAKQKRVDPVVEAQMTIG